MFSSPARPTPRKSIFRGRGDTASVSRGTPSVISEREHQLATPSRPSRVNALKRAASPTSTAGETSRTAMRYEEGSERIHFGKDERAEIYSLGGLPREVQTIVKNSELVTLPINGHIDSASGYAYITTEDICLAWNCAKRTSSSPTVYVFSCPRSSTRLFSSHSIPPVLAAFHYTGSGEPGVILVSLTGEIRFWENVSQALSNVDRYSAIQLDLGQDDYAEKIWSVDPNTFIITTTSSLAFRLSITSHSGRQTPSVIQLMRPGGMFGRASPTIFSQTEDRQGITSVAAAGTDLLILASKTLQKWHLGNEGQKDIDLYEIVGNGLYPDRWSSGDIQLIIHDILTVGQGHLAALIYSSNSTAASSQSALYQARYNIVILGPSGRAGNVGIIRSIPISYIPELPDPRVNDVPRLIIPADSSTAFVRLPCVVLMVALVEGDNNEETISLKVPALNVFIGTGHLINSNVKRPSPSLILMPASGGLIGIETFSPPIASRGLSTEAQATKRLKSKMEQAVFFADRSENPLSFDVTSSVEGDISAAAEAVSAEILSCNSTHMSGMYELRAQLSDRLVRLKELIGYIRRNGLLVKLPQASRRLLSRDGEKARAGVDLWDYQNRLMDQIQTSSPQSLLSDSIIAYMDQYANREDEDMIRQFFRHQCQHLDKLLEIVYATFKNAVESLGEGSERSAWVLEANKVFIIIVRAAAQYREDTLSLYEQNRQSPTIEQWTAQSIIMSPLEDLYSITETLIAERTRDLGSAIDSIPSAIEAQGQGQGEIKSQRSVQNILKNQLAELAAALCNNMEDKLRTTSRHMEEGGEEQEGLALQRKWEMMRPRVIRPLVAVDRVSQAYDLAEHHNDYDTLVWLCHEPAAAASGKGGVVRLQEYIERFEEQFAFVLYQWYIDQGQQHALLSQDEVYGSLVTKFFKMTDYPELAWLHHVACGRYGAAAKALAMVDEREPGLDSKHIINSIGKLAAVAERVASNKYDDERIEVQAGFDDQLDFNNIQESLRSALTSSSRRSTSPQDALSEYLGKNLTLLVSRPAFLSLIQDLAGRLVSGEALDIEGLADVLTLKDNLDERGRGDPCMALQKLRSDKTLPDGRKQVTMLSIWRRVYIRDDWIYLSNTTGKSEERIKDMLRKTLTYATLKATGEIEDFPQNYIISPFTAAIPPLREELSARFPEKTSEEIDALMRDHESEIEVLNRFTEEAGLEARVKEVAELVKRDSAGLEGVVQGEEEDEDVDM